MRPTGTELSADDYSPRKFDNEKKEKVRTNIYLLKCLSQPQSGLLKGDDFICVYISILEEALPTISITNHLFN